MSAHQTTQTAATVTTPLLPRSGQASASAHTPDHNVSDLAGGAQDYGALERGGEEDEAERWVSHPLRVQARDFKACLAVFFVVCALFLAGGILRSLGWGDDIVDEPVYNI